MSLEPALLTNLSVKYDPIKESLTTALESLNAYQGKSDTVDTALQEIRALLEALSSGGGGGLSPEEIANLESLGASIDAINATMRLAIDSQGFAVGDSVQVNSERNVLEMFGGTWFKHDFTIFDRESYPDFPDDALEYFPYPDHPLSGMEQLEGRRAVTIGDIMYIYGDNDGDDVPHLHAINIETGEIIFQPTELTVVGNGDGYDYRYPDSMYLINGVIEIIFDDMRNAIDPVALTLTVGDEFPDSSDMSLDRICGHPNGVIVRNDNIDRYVLYPNDLSSHTILPDSYKAANDGGKLTRHGDTFIGEEGERYDLDLKLIPDLALIRLRGDAEARGSNGVTVVDFRYGDAVVYRESVGSNGPNYSESIRTFIRVK